jgi:ABC-type glycerol-3-phosphate transport system permease component
VRGSAGASRAGPHAFNYEGQYTINMPAILAAVVLSMLPILALYAAARRQLLRTEIGRKLD